MIIASTLGVVVMQCFLSVRVGRAGSWSFVSSPGHEGVNLVYIVVITFLKRAASGICLQSTASHHPPDVARQVNWQVGQHSRRVACHAHSGSAKVDTPGAVGEHPATP